MGKNEKAVGMDEGKGGSSGVEGGGPGPSETRREANPAEEKRVNPSAPGETGTTPGTNAK